MYRRFRRVAIVIALVIVGVLPHSMISAQGSTWATGVNIQNLSPDQPATFQMDVYDASGLVVATIARPPIPAGGSANVYLPSEAGVPTGLFSSVLASDQPLAAVVNTVNRESRQGDSYLGTGNAGLSLTAYAPLIYRNHNGYNSTIYIQNAHTGSQQITLSLFTTGSSTATVTKTYTVPASASVEAMLSSGDFAGFGNGYGAATVEGAAGPVALAVSYVRDPSQGVGAIVNGQYRGLTPGSADTALYAPLVYRGHNSWETGISVLNITDVATTVTVTLTASDQSIHSGAVVVLTQVVGPHASGVFYLPSYPQIPSSSFFGAARISADQNILAIVNNTNYGRSDAMVGSCYEAISAMSASSSIAGPLVYRMYADADTGINVQNLGADASDITLVYQSTLSSDQWSFTNSAVPAGGVTTFYMPSLMPGTTGVFGSAVITTNDGNPILAVFNSPAYPRGLSANYAGINIVQ